MKNVKKGRRPKQIDVDKLNLMISMGVPKTRIALELSISRRTLYRTLETINEED